MHSIFSPSSAHRWLRCPASVKLEQQYPSTSNIHSIKGSLMHDIAERVIKGEEIQSFLNKTIDDILITTEMLQIISTYTEFIKLAIRNSDAYFLEKKVRFYKIHELGFGTADCIIIKNKTLYVIDFKTGRYPVEVCKNLQLILYAVGFFNENSLNFDINVVQLIVVQPLVSVKPSNWSLPVEKIEIIEKFARSMCLNALSDNPIFKAGEHCRFCKHRENCRELKNEKNK